MLHRGVYRPDLETAPHERIRAHQLARLNDLLARILPGNAYYGPRLAKMRPPLAWDTFQQVPFTTKSDLVADQNAVPPFGSMAAEPPERYITYHQTSGTTGTPLIVLDTAESWRWWTECWRYVYAAAGVTARDRIFFPFSFGPFIGFWSAFEAARELGALTIPGGGLESKGRLQLLRRSEATVLVCTPTYALRLAEVAFADGIPIRDSRVQVTIHAGEPGASIPSVRDRIEAAWGARTFDHAGGTEVGAYGYSCDLRHGLHLNEAEFIAEILDPESGQPVADGNDGELVITNLGRAAWPVIRYRTGDLVTSGGRTCACGRTFLLAPGGIIGRTDDLIVLRGVNVFPSAIEAIVRTFDVDEFRVVRTNEGTREELTVEIEGSAAAAERLAAALRERLGVRIATTVAAAGSLPRFELKARRVVDRRAV